MPRTTSRKKLIYILHLQNLWWRRRLNDGIQFQLEIWKMSRRRPCSIHDEDLLIKPFVWCPSRCCYRHGLLKLPNFYIKWLSCLVSKCKNSHMYKLESQHRLCTFKLNLVSNTSLFKMEMKIIMMIGNFSHQIASASSMIRLSKPRDFEELSDVLHVHVLNIAISHK